MTFALLPGEILRKGLRLERGSGVLSILLFFVPFMFRASQNVLITDRRLIVADVPKWRGDEVAAYIPLESIQHVKRERRSKSRWLYLAIALFVLAALSTPFANQTLAEHWPGFLADLFSEGTGSSAQAWAFVVLGLFPLLLYIASIQEEMIVNGPSDKGSKTGVLIFSGRSVRRIEDLDGNRLYRDELDNLREELESARQECVRKNDGKEPAREEADPDDEE